MQRAAALVLGPELLQLVLPVELTSQPAEEAFVPLLRREVLAQGGQVEDRDLHARLAEASGGADHEGAFAHLARGEHVAELPAEEGFVQVSLRLALDVR